jgi:hypothetical protein
MNRPERWLVLLGAVTLAVAVGVVVSRFRSRSTPAPRPITTVEPTPRPPRDGEPTGTVLAFRDIAAEAGLTQPHFNAADGRFRLVETMGSGVGLIDFDDDGRLDIFVAQGCPLPLDPEQRQHVSRLYRNRGDGRFYDVTDAAGVAFHGYGQGVAVGDYDGDGREDLFVAGFERSALYRNRGDGSFEDTTERAGVAGSGWPTSCAFADLDHDGDLDLFVVHYLANTVDADGAPTVSCNATPGHLGYCPPGVFAPEPDVLYRNNGDGTFTDVSEESGIAAVAGNGLGLAIADFDDDGKLDVFVANDQSPNFLYHNQGGLRFEETALGWGLAYNESGQVRAGMGVACGDYDDDGRTDLLVTNFYEEGDTLYRNVGPWDFQVTTSRARLAAPSRRVLGFGVGFLDADLDGRLDLLAANGHINDVRPLGMPYAMPPQLFHNRGDGRFAEVTATAGDYFRGQWLGRAAAFGDLDDDGDPDAVITHLGRPPALLRNDTPREGHFLSIELRANGLGRRPIGARVTAFAAGRRIVRELAGGTSYQASGDPRLPIGLGGAPRVERLEVRWPSGRVQVWEDVAADRSYRIPGEGAALETIGPP